MEKKREENIKLESSKESFLLKLIIQIADKLKKDHAYTNEQLFELLQAEEKILLIPISIFSEKLAPSEALIKYLKETHDLNYHEISELINRNERGIWASYQRAKKKLSSKFVIKPDTITVPLSIFKNRSLSILECLISYLKEIKHLKNKKIAKLINKNPANIWTIYNRAKKKTSK